MKVCPGYREKSSDLKGPFRLHLQFYNRILGSQRPTMKIGMFIFSACMQYSYKCIHVSRVTYKRLSHVLSSVARSPHSLAGFACAVQNIFVYLASIFTHCEACSQARSVLQCVSTDISCWQNTPCLHVQISATPLPGYGHIFQQCLLHTYVYIWM